MGLEGQQLNYTSWNQYLDELEDLDVDDPRYQIKVEEIYTDLRTTPEFSFDDTKQVYDQLGDGDLEEAENLVDEILNEKAD